MTRLFILLYVGVLAVLFAAWYLHGKVSERRAEADRSRVFEEAHGGGARLVASAVDAAPDDRRDQVLQSLRERFDYPIQLVPLDRLPTSIQQRISRGDDVVRAVLKEKDDEEEVVVAALSSGTEVVSLGPFPNYGLRSVEDSIRGWMRLAADKLESTPPGQQQAALKDLQDWFEFPIDVAKREDLPDWPKGRLSSGADVVFYPTKSPASEDRWFAAARVSDGSEVVRCGPFPKWENVEQKAATTTLALVLLPAALAIALLLRPVVRQLRHVEHAAEEIAAGDLTARVDERRVRSAKPLAQAFNNMASRTEALVRTQRELLQAVSHELRTPLSRMRFAIDLIAAAKDNAERQQRLDALDAATSELDELVGELLRYVRMETTEPQLTRERIALQDTFDDLIPKHAALHPAIQFDIDESIGEQGVVVADQAGFQRALGNLLSNAGRFANSRVIVKAATSNGSVTVDVDDDGGGIPDSDRERVFEPFVRLENGSNGRGAGLGLALVKRIVTQHGGSIDVRTSPLGGCRMRTSWPKTE
jgi:two-component system sensor histidine kinase RstB